MLKTLGDLMNESHYICSILFERRIDKGVVNNNDLGPYVVASKPSSGSLLGFVAAPRLGSVSPAIGPVRIMLAGVRFNYTWVKKHVTSPPEHPFPPPSLKLPNDPDGELPSGQDFASEIRSYFSKGLKSVRYLEVPSDLKSNSTPPHFNSGINVDSRIVSKKGLVFQVGVFGRDSKGKILFAVHAWFDLSRILPVGILEPEKLDTNIVETAGLIFGTFIAEDNQVVDPLFLVDSSYAEGVLCRNYKNKFGSPCLFFLGLSLKCIWLRPPKGQRLGSIAHVDGSTENSVADALSRWEDKNITDRVVFERARSDQGSFCAIFLQRSAQARKRNIEIGIRFKRLVRVLLMFFGNEH